MFDFSNSRFCDLQAFFHVQSEALQNASVLLGGQPALRRTQRLLDKVAASGQISTWLHRELISLYHLLSLQNAHEADCVEAAYFADLDPASPETEDICLLCDQLFDQLRALGFAPEVLEPDLAFAA
jgi:hypothetical protein